MAIALPEVTEVSRVGLRSLALLGVVAAVATALLSWGAGSATGGFALRALFVACWLTAALLVAWRGESGVVSAVTVVFLISFPIAFAGASAGVHLLDQLWRVVGSTSVVAFLYLFPRGQFEPRWTAVSCAVSTAYLTARAFLPGLASWPGDLVVFPVIVVLPLCLQVVRFRWASNAGDRRRLHIVGITSAAALIGQLILFGLLAAGWLGPEAAAESVVEPVSYALALLMPAGVALAVVPLGSRTRQLADRFALSGDDATELIVRLNALAQTSSAGRDLVPVAAEAIRRSLRVPTVSIDLAGPGDSIPSSAMPSRPAPGRSTPGRSTPNRATASRATASRATAGRASPGDPLPRAADGSWPLTYRGRCLGFLRVTPRPGGQLSVGDRQILDQLSVQLAPLVGSAHLADQLDEARTRLLNVREEERRRLRGDLHDELGATLAGLTLKTGLARSLLDRDPEATRRLLGEIETNLKTSVGRVRELVEGLRPAQLDELGLVAAIKEQAERLVPSGSAMAVRVHGHAAPGLPAAVELAAYRIAQEALTNAVRHSGGSWVDVELAVDRDDQRLTVRVADDGVGLREAEPAGFGIPSMRQRAREVGGECALRTGTSGGVVVTVVLPLTMGGAT